MRAMSMRHRRLARLGILVAAVAALAGCNVDNMLKVKNPGAVDAENLKSPYYLDLLTNGVVGEFQKMQDWNGVYAATFSGEVINHHVYYEEGDISSRNVQGQVVNSAIQSTNGTLSLAGYNAIHRVRWLADSTASRMKTLMGDTAKKDLRLARVLAYGGYAYVYLGEQMCFSPINGGPMKTSDEILAMAPSRFDEAIQVAQQAKAWAAAYTPDSYWSATALTKYRNGADSIMNMARVGAARAYLDLNNKAKAIEYASAVTPVWTSDASPTTRGFVMWSYYADIASYDNQWYYRIALAAGSGSRTASLFGTPYDGVQDPRIPQQRINVMDGYNSLGNPPGVNVPKSTPAFSTYDGTLTGAEVTKAASLRIASAIEARYILAEAQGKAGAGNIDFLNNRRALAGMAPVDASISDVDYRNALIEQRTRDMYLDGHRLGDIRRYKKYYGLDFYLRGKFPTSATLQFGSAECMPIPLGEWQGNPNLAQ